MIRDIPSNSNLVFDLHSAEAAVDGEGVVDAAQAGAAPVHARHRDAVAAHQGSAPVDAPLLCYRRRVRASVAVGLK